MSREGLTINTKGGNNFDNNYPRDYGATSSSTASNFASFSPTEFISLSDSIGSNIVAVKSSWQLLEKANKTIGTNKDNQSVRDKVHAVQTTTNQKITTTTKDLHRLSQIVRHGDNIQKLQVERLTADFKYVVEIYSKSQQVIAAKMKQILLVGIYPSDNNYDSQSSMTNNENTEKLIQQQRQMQFEEDMLLEREQRIRQIEADVLDVNEIMKDLSNLVQTQAETIDTIENTIDHAVGNVESGRSELEKAAEYHAKYRRKVLILLAIAVIIGIIVTLIIVSQLKS
uniref:Putative snare protein pep12/vam3/syntaxin 7/syntaxin 17 n=1 Tax=Corethrella appendiculata TaxID=1370023 RepID=U5EIB6_9DIPT